MKKSITKLFLTLFAASSLTACGKTKASIDNEKEIIQHDKSGAKYENGVFHNTDIDWNMNFGQMWEAMTSPKHQIPTPDHSLPSQKIPDAELVASGVDRLFRLGHSMVLMELDKHWIITDPVFVERASPLQWLGPKRFDEMPIMPAKLPNLKAVLISHNHYDHLNKESIVSLIDKTEHFIVPLKLGALLQNWGVPSNKIIELDWWQGVELAGLTISATPAQHYTSRSLWDRNKSLWASFVLETKSTRVFFSGDTGYFKGFAEIGEYFGSFDLALLEVGAYNELWRDIHMMPQDAIQAFKDLNAQAFVPIHNGTFDLGKHAWWEPFEVIENLSIENNIKISQPMFGEQVLIKKPQNTLAWWKELIPQNEESILALQ